MKKHAYWFYLAVIYVVFIGVSVPIYIADSDLASQGKYILAKDRSLNPIELIFTAMDGRAAWEKLTWRIDMEEAKMAQPAGHLNFWMWLKDYTGFYRYGFLPFMFTLLATWLMVLVSGFRLCQRFRTAAAA